MSELSDVTEQEQAADIGPSDGAPPRQEAPKEEPAVELKPREPRRLNIIGRRNLFFALSLIVIIPGILRFIHMFSTNAVHSEALNGSVIQTSGGGYIIRYPPLNAASQASVENDLQKRLGPFTGGQPQSILEVGGTIAGETIFYSILAVVLASVSILILLMFRFRNVPGGWRAGFQFGGSALAALLHDVFILTGLFSIFGTVLHWRVGEIDAFFVTAVLTVVGFSVHDTIVVFDRVRENLRVSQRLSFDQVVNLSIMQTAARSIITSFTVVLVLAAIFLAGGTTLQGLALALAIGIISGTYSSIFNAAPLLVVWRKLQPLR